MWGKPAYELISLLVSQPVMHISDNVVVKAFILAIIKFQVIVVDIIILVANECFFSANVTASSQLELNPCHYSARPLWAVAM